jgi:hypothetical protein
LSRKTPDFIVKIMSSNRRAFATIAFLVAALSQFGCSDDDTAGTWIDHTYLLDVPNTSWSKPTPRIGSEIGDFVPNFVLEVSKGEGSQLAVTLGTAVDGAQDLCNPTTVVNADADYPSIQVGPSEFPLHIKHLTADVTVNATAYDLSLTDVLPNKDTASREGVLSATLDTRELYPLFTLLPAPSPESVCAALESFDAPCQPCPADRELFCLTIQANYLGAIETSLALEAVEAANVDASCL